MYCVVNLILICTCVHEHVRRHALCSKFNINHFMVKIIFAENNNENTVIKSLHKQCTCNSMCLDTCVCFNFAKWLVYED